MIVRFIIYGVVIFILLYLIMQQNEGKDESKKIEQIELDTTNIDE